MVHINIDPVLWRWGPLAIGWHSLWITASVVIAYFVVVWEGRRKGITHPVLMQLFLWAIILGYLGARLLYVLDHWEVYAAQPLRALAVQRGGFALYGALIGGILAALGFARWKKLPFWSLADAIALGIPVGEIVGRVGCTINGDVWGNPTNGAWGLVYWHPAAALPPDLLGVPTFPAPTALQIWNAGLLALLIVLRKRVYRPGAVFLTCTIVYALGRFIVSIWQAREPFLFGLKQAQVISLGVIGLGIGLVYVCMVRTRGTNYRRGAEDAEEI